MSIARKILLLAGMALAAMAMTATTASAQETAVEVVNEPNGNACVPCQIHVDGEARITALPSGVVVSQCEDEMTGNINHNGTGEVEWVGGAHSGPGCNVVNCAAPERHWPITAIGELGGGQEHATVRFCLSSGAELHCNAEVRIAPISGHVYGFATHALCAGGAREVEGSWITEANDRKFELVHAVN